MSGVFISYRRDDTAGYAGRLYDALSAEFGKRLVFIDIDSIRGGEDFVKAIDKRIRSSSVVLVLIGKGWLNSGGANGRRLDDPQDFVRLEVASALRQKIPVIPVLVGGAKMPRPGDLPAPLAGLAHLNAIEIFDQLFHDSVRHLIEELRPFVPRNSLFRGWTRRGVAGIGIFALIMLGALIVALGIERLLTKIGPHPTASSSQEAAPDALPPAISEELAESDESETPRIKVTTPADISEVPPVVEEAKNVTLAGNSTQVTGPSAPRILWRAHVTVGDEWKIAGVASDGTVFLHDSESNIVEGVRDGKELWAHPSQSPMGFDAEGRLWTKDPVSDMQSSFNSRGEGGRVTKRSLWQDAAKLRPPAQSQQDYYSCREGKVLRYSRYKPVWSVDLDGNCGHQDVLVVPETGNLYVSSDLGTLYAISPAGQVLWTVQHACKDAYYNVYPVSADEVVIPCRRQALYALRGGKLLWTSTLGASGGWFWGDVISDAAGNIYIGGEGPPISGYIKMGRLIALDKAGRQKWTVSAGKSDAPNPVGFDDRGRLYVEIWGRIVALSQ